MDLKQKEQEGSFPAVFPNYLFPLAVCWVPANWNP